MRWGIIEDELAGRQFTGMKVAKSKVNNTTSYEVNDEGYILYKKTINELWPIPLSELEINENLKQNTGYK